MHKNYLFYAFLLFLGVNNSLKSKRKKKKKKKKKTLIPKNLCKNERLVLRLIESMMELRPRQGNLRLVFRLFSLMRGMPSIRLI